MPSAAPGSLYVTLLLHYTALYYAGGAVLWRCRALLPLFISAGDLARTSDMMPGLQLLMQTERCAAAGPGFVAHGLCVAVGRGLLRPSELVAPPLLYIYLGRCGLAP